MVDNSRDNSQSFYVREFFAQDYGCLKEVRMQLTPLHALIGPNDSGKSTVLRGIRTLLQLLSGSFSFQDGIKVKPFDSGFFKRNSRVILQVGFNSNAFYIVQDVDNFDALEILGIGSKKFKSPRNMRQKLAVIQKINLSHFPENDRQWAGLLIDRFRLQAPNQRLVRFDPDAMRQQSSLIPEGQLMNFLDDRGLGLPGVLDAIISRDVEGFLDIQEQLRTLFPVVEKLQIVAVSDSTKEIRVKLSTGEVIPARFMSEGLLYYLAFAALAHLEPTTVLLVEEPENGLHPARIADVMRILRKISETTQVLIATHSPLVVNELEPEEVSVVTRTEEKGTRVTPIKDTPNFQARSSVYALGELWVSYANGDDEGPLFDEPEVAEELDEGDWVDDEDEGDEADNG